MRTVLSKTLIALVAVSLSGAAHAACTGVVKSGILDAPTDKNVEITPQAPTVEVGAIRFEVMYRSGVPYAMTVTNTDKGMVAESVIPSGAGGDENRFSVRLAHVDEEKGVAYIQCSAAASAGAQ